MVEAGASPRTSDPCGGPGRLAAEADQVCTCQAVAETLAQWGIRVINGVCNFVYLPKYGEHYIFLFDDAHRADVLNVLGRWASRSDLALTWYDAAVLSQRVRKMLAEGKKE